MTPKQIRIKAVDQLNALLIEQEEQLSKSMILAIKESSDADKKCVFGIGVTIHCDIDKEEIETKTSYGIKIVRSLTGKPDDPNQDQMPFIQKEQEAFPCAMCRKLCVLSDDGFRWWCSDCQLSWKTAQEPAAPRDTSSDIDDNFDGEEGEDGE